MITSKSANHTLQNKTNHLFLINNFHLPDIYTVGKMALCKFRHAKNPDKS